MLSSNGERQNKSMCVYVTASESTQTIINNLRGSKRAYSSRSGVICIVQTVTISMVNKPTQRPLPQQTAQHSRENGVSAEAAERKHGAEGHTCRSLSL